MIDRIVNMIFPPRCAFCGKFLDISSEMGFCDSCKDALPLTARFDGPVKGSFYDGLISLFEYKGKVKESLHRYKFFNRPSYCRTYGHLMTSRIAGEYEKNSHDIIMAVPLHVTRKLSRGYNQSQLISRYMAGGLKIKEGSGLLARVGKTGSQSLLPGDKRKINVAGAFKVRFPGKVKGRKILLVDDILTTGSTINECSRVLKEAGAVRITACVVAVSPIAGKHSVN